MRHIAIGIAALCLGAAVVAPAAAQDVAKAKAALQAGLDAYNEGRMEAAEPKLREAFTEMQNGPDKDPGVYADTLWYLGQALTKLGLAGGKPEKWDWDKLWEGETLLTDTCATDKYKGNADSWYALAFLRSKMAPNNNSYRDLLSEKGLQACDQALTLNAKHPLAGRLKGRLQAAVHAKRDLAGAAATLKKDLENFPGRAETAVILCGVYEGLNDAKGMEWAAREGLKGDPESSKLRIWLGKAFWRGGNMGAAADQFKQAADRDPDNLEAVNMWAQAAAASDPNPDKLLAALTAHAEKHKKSWVADQVKAGILIQIGRGDEAIAALQSLVKRFPENKHVATWEIMQADQYGTKGDAGIQPRVDAVCRALKAEPTSAEAWRRLWLEVSKGQYEAIWDRYKRTGEFDKGATVAMQVAEAITSDADHESWAVNKGLCYWVAWECYANLGKNDEAEKAIKEAIRLDQRNAAYNNCYGLLLRYMGRIDDAIAQWRKALEKQINLPWAWENLASTYLSLGKIREAREVLTQGLEWARQEEQQYGQDELASLQAAQFETWKLRRLLIEAWRIERGEQKK